jgi:hypothetical protein
MIHGQAIRCYLMSASNDSNRVGYMMYINRHFAECYPSVISISSRDVEQKITV